MRPFLAAILMIALAALTGWIWLAPTPSGASTRPWYRGVETFYSRVGDAVEEKLASRADGGRVLVGLRRAPNCEYVFSSPNAADLVDRLEKRFAGRTPSVTFTRVDEDELAPRALALDLVVDIDIEAGEPPAEATLRAELRSDPGDPINLEVACPTGQLHWFLRRARPPLWQLIACATLFAAGVMLVFFGARDSYCRRFAGGGRMWSGAALILGTTAYAAFCCQPPRTEVRSVGSLPEIDVVLDTSDAVLFPPTGSDSEIDGRNTLSLLVQMTVERVRDMMEARQAPSRVGFRQWARDTIPALLGGKFEMALGQQINSTLVMHHSIPGLRGNRDADLKRTTDVSLLPSILRCEHRGIEPGVFVPRAIVREASSGTAGRRVVICFLTAEAVSPAEIVDLEKKVAEREGDEGVTVFTVLLPALPRSGSPHESEEERLRLATLLSDRVVSLNKLPPGWESPGTVPVSSVALFECDRLVDARREEWQTPRDLDVERTKVFDSPAIGIEAAAEQIAAQVRKVVEESEIRETTAVLAIADFKLVLFVVAAALVLLFLGIQDELTFLGLADYGAMSHHTGSVGQRSDLALALLPLVLGLAMGVFFVYTRHDSASWAVAGKPTLIIWACVLWWFAALWFPMLLGRSAGTLAGRRDALNTRLVFWGLCTGLLLLVIPAALALGVALAGGEVASAALIDRATVWLWSAALAVLAILSLWMSWSELGSHRRRTVFVLGWLGFVGCASVPFQFGLLPDGADVWLAITAILAIALHAAMCRSWGAVLVASLGLALVVLGLVDLGIASSPPQQISQIVLSIVLPALGGALAFRRFPLGSPRSPEHGRPIWTGMAWGQRGAVFLMCATLFGAALILGSARAAPAAEVGATRSSLFIDYYTMFVAFAWTAASAIVCLRFRTIMREFS